MKINPGQTRGFDRILDRQFGTGTSISNEGAAVILTPGAKDQILLSQQGNRLQIVVNGSEKFLLTERESENFAIRGDQKNVTIDPSVSLLATLQNTGRNESAKQEGAISGDPQLAHARQMEGAFETAVTRNTITADLKEDVFIHHIGKQMQHFLEETGFPLKSSAPFRTEKDLLPLMTQLEKITGKVGGSIPLPREFLQDLNRIVTNLQSEIKNGTPPELDFLGSQMTRGLQQIIRSKNEPSEMQPGKIPFEAREIPLGMGQRDAFQKWGLINESIVRNDAEIIRQFASDPAFLKLALPEEKAAFVNVLSNLAVTPGIQQADKMLHLQSIVQFLQSAQNTQEFRSILNMAGVEKVQGAMKEAPDDYNITAHVFQTPEFALNQNQPSFLTNPFLQGFTPQQILTARQEISLSTQDRQLQPSLWATQDAGRFSENALFVAVSTPDEKAMMIEGLQTGYVSVQDERSIINILQSAPDKTEFDQIVETAGGKAIGLALQDPASIVKWNRLAGAYDRMDLTTDFVEGVKMSGALLEPSTIDTPPLLIPLNAPQISRNQRVQDVAQIIDTFLKDVGTWIGNQVGMPDRRAYVEGILENLNRSMEGLPVLNFPALRNQLHAILESPTVQAAQIVHYLQTLPAATGLSGYELRNLISQPLTFLYTAAAHQADTLAKSVVAFFQDNLQLSIFNYGPKSPQARLLQGQMQTVQTAFLPFVEHLKSVSKILSEAFPPPANLIVSLPQFSTVFQNNFAPILSDVLMAFPGTVSDTQKSSTISQIVSQLTNASQGAELIRSGEMERKFTEASELLHRLPGAPPDLLQFTKQAASVFSAIRDGSFAKTLKEVASNLKKYDDPIAELAKTTADGGAVFLSQLQNGIVTKVQAEFIKELDKFQNDPAFATLTKYLGQIRSLSEGILENKDSPEIIDEASQFISEIAGEGFRGALTNIGQAAARFRESPVFRNLIDLMERGGKFLTAMRSGNLAQTMELMHSRFGYSPAVVQLMERGLHLSTTGSFVVKTLIGRDFERPMAQITRKAQSKTEAAKEIAEAQTIFSSASTFFYALSDVQNMDLLWQYHRQLGLLKDEVLIDSTIRQFEKQAQVLAAEPDLKKSLSSQFAALKRNRSENSQS